MKIENKGDQGIALGMANTLIGITKWEIYYRQAIKDRTRVGKEVQDKHNLLLMGRRSMLTELLDMDYEELAHQSLRLGTMMAHTEINRSKK